MVTLDNVRKSRLSKYKQARLTQHFIAGTTARTAAAFCGVNRKTAAYYSHRLGEIVALELEAEGEALFDGEIEVDESYSGGNRKGHRERRVRGKHQYLANSSMVERFTRRSFPMRRRHLCSRSWRTRLCLPASSIAMVGGATPCLMCQTSITSGSTIRNYLPTSKTTSAGLRISGARRCAICASLTVSQGLISGCLQRNACGDLTAVTC
jgi:transposase-like protein